MLLLLLLLLLHVKYEDMGTNKRRGTFETMKSYRNVGGTLDVIKERS